ncbi:MAG: hypothetical protein ACRCUY_04715, partial [Thermoguttaceae bacterium]
MHRIVSIIVFCVLLFFAAFAAAADILVADFEGDSYGNWKAEGTAFGTGPATGTFPKQGKVTGFEGKGLVNTFIDGDGPTGKLTSPSFKIERRYMNFLIGGGGHAGLALNLLVDGKVVRTATGPNIVSGGSEALERAEWNLDDLQGKDAVIEIIDAASDGWGHINVDSLVLSDNPVPKRIEKSRALVIEPTASFLHLP